MVMTFEKCSQGYGRNWITILGCIACLRIPDRNREKCWGVEGGVDSK